MPYQQRRREGKRGDRGNGWGKEEERDRGGTGGTEGQIRREDREGTEGQRRRQRWLHQGLFSITGAYLPPPPPYLPVLQADHVNHKGIKCNVTGVYDFSGIAAAGTAVVMPFEHTHRCNCDTLDERQPKDDDIVLNSTCSNFSVAFPTSCIM